MDFNREINRKNTDCMKYDSASMMHMPEGLIPMWVADMDFHVPDPVTEAIHARTDHGIFGYGFAGEGYLNAVTGWFAENFGADFDPKWIVSTPGVVYALCTAVRAFTEPGDGVMLNRPVYYPFSNAINDNARRVVNAPLKYEDGAYSLDLELIEELIVKEDVKLYLFCSPHNPVSRVWSEEELKKLVDICARHGVILVSDEIHCDFVWPGHTHTCLHNAAAGTDLKYVVCTAPSKTFNLAGLQASNIIIPDRELRRAFRAEMSAGGILGLNVMGMIACQAAYEKGLDWLNELRAYIYDNIQYVKAFLEENIPQIRLIDTQGTYLLWLDCSGLGIEGKELDEFMIEWAGLWLDGGSMFGPEGKNFQRINAACTRATLEKAMKRLKQAAKAFVSE